MTCAPGRRLAPALALLVVLAACSPTLDWREVRPEGDTLVALFPCRPELRQRVVPIAGADRTMSQLACEAGGVHVSLAFVDADAPERVEPLMAALKASLSGNLGVSMPQTPSASAPSFAPAGATPNAGSGRIALAGHRPDGAPLKAESGLFVHGLRVYQATVLGDAPNGEATSTFLQSLRFTPTREPSRAASP